MRGTLQMFSTSLAGHSGLAGRGPAGQPPAGRRGAPACVPAESECGAEHGASGTHFGPQSPGEDPRHCKLPRKQRQAPAPHARLPGAHPPGTSTRWGWKRGGPEPFHPSPCLCAADGSQWRLESPPPPCTLPAGRNCGELLQLPPWATENHSTPGKVLPPTGMVREESNQRWS